MTFLFVGVFISYALLVIGLYIGWRKATRHPRGEQPQDHVISVIVPVRNEEGNIGYLLEDLFSQQFPSDKFEIIVVDDHSEDGTVVRIERKLKTTPFSNFKIAPSVGKGKKTAITTGVQHAKGELIVTTDADCRINSNWLQYINDAFASDEVKMVCGPVRIETNRSFFSKMQTLEFSSLIGSGAATLALGAPTMCNGANLAFRKEVFHEVGGFEGNVQIASGDDEFLMRKIAEKYPGGINFNNAQSSIVTTQPQQSLSLFISQRLRWAGKWKHHQDLKSKLLAIYIFIFHVTVLSLPVLFVIGYVSSYELLALLLLKLVVEFIFLHAVTSWLNIRWHWPSFIVLQLIYPVYAIGIGLTSLFKRPSWKGRK